MNLHKQEMVLEYREKGRNYTPTPEEIFSARIFKYNSTNTTIHIWLHQSNTVWNI